MNLATQLSPPPPLTAHLRQWFNSPPPQIVVEVSASHVLAARGDLHSGAVVSTAARALPPGMVAPSLIQTNLSDPAPLAGHIEHVLRQVGGMDREVILLVPDLTARVALLEFDSIPSRPGEIEELVRFRLRKTLPFDVEHAAVNCQVIGSGAGQRVLAILAQRERLNEYEDCLEAAGVRAGVVLPSGLAALSASPALEHAALLLRALDGTLCSAFCWQGVLQLYRIVETDAGHGPSYDEVFPSVAFFRDFWETHGAGSGSTAGVEEAPPLVVTAGLSEDVFAQLEAEAPWARVIRGVPGQIDAGAAPAPYLFAAAGALNNVR